MKLEFYQQESQMLVSESTGFSLQVKTEEYAYHLDIERAAEKDCYKVRYGRGVSNSVYYISNAGWQRFLEKCKDIGIFNWEEIYDFPSFSGYGWFLKFGFPYGKEISFAGRYRYPENWEIFITFLEDFTNQGTWFGSDPVDKNAQTQKVLRSDENKQTEQKPVEAAAAESGSKGYYEEAGRQPTREDEFTPPFIDQKPDDYKVKLEDLFNEEELETENKNAFDKQVAKFSTFVKTGSHAFVNLILDKNDEKKKG